MTDSVCAYCGDAIKAWGVRRYCGPKCKNAWYRAGGTEPKDPTEGTLTWRGMSKHSADNWDGISVYSPSAYVVERHMATCLACGRTVEPTDPVQWRRAIGTLQCEVCGGNLLVELQDVGAMRSSNEGRIRKRTDDRPLRTRMAG